MPTEMALTCVRIGSLAIMPFSSITFTASRSATQAPAIEAQRVPPSACKTSQSN